MGMVALEDFFATAASGRATTVQQWHRYLEAFHAQLPRANGLFILLRTPAGKTSYSVLAHAVAASGAASVLDLGCGEGNLLDDLRDALRPDASIVASDISGESLDLARERHGTDPRIRFVQADLRALPFGDGAFDCVAAHQVLNLFPDIDAALGEVARVLRPGGELLFAANRGWRGDRAANWIVLHEAAMEEMRKIYPDFVWPRMGDPRVYAEDGIAGIFAGRPEWDSQSLSIKTFYTSASMTPDRIAATYNRLYIFGTAPERDRILAAVERRAKELAHGDTVAIELPFRVIRIRKTGS